MTFVFDARTFEPALPANDDAPSAPLLRLVETPEISRPRRLRRGLLGRTR